ncbi:MAG: YcjF family protein [Paracoccaceae bacterium]
MTGKRQRQGPVLLEGDKVPPPAGSDPATAPPVPDDEMPPPAGRAMQAVTLRAGRKPSWAGRIFWSALTGLLGLMAGVAFWDFVAGLAKRNPVLGNLALVLALAVGVLLLLAVLREVLALIRLRRVDGLRRTTEDAWSEASLGPARKAVAALTSFYSGRRELGWARGDLREQADGLLDGDALLGFAENRLLTPLDAQARREIEAASRKVAAATAFVPLALADVAAAAVVNIGMIRRIAEIYGARAGWLGSLRLLRAVATHLVATGAVAVGDDLIGSVAGGGVLSRISRRFGEGVVNGALTARVGVAAMEICRPMPFRSEKRPRVSSIVSSALTGFLSSGKASR